MESLVDNNVGLNNTTNKCFIDLLSRLKESSLEAVESSKKLNPLTKYMHVIRTVQKEFHDIVNMASETDKAELILLCGSVGDGKSHLLSYYNDNYPELMNKFQIHNDSTASFYINKPAIHTLREVLDEFSDRKIFSSSKKLILAINLGTLNNFIEADVNDEFKMLKKFIDIENILKESISVSLANDITSNFYFVNFTDYHLYNLAEESPKSSYIENLIVKLISDKEVNPFRNEYKNCCQNCLSYGVCPVRANYEMLSSPVFRNESIQIIIESIVKNKIIVSTRALLNLIYEMIVDERFIRTGSLEPRKDIMKLSPISYCKALLPNSIFSRLESSITINSFKEIDPLDVRNEKIDTFIVEFTNEEKILKVFQEFIPESKAYLEKFDSINFSENSSIVLKQELLKLFIRMYRLFNKNHLFVVKDTLYHNYMKNLYYWNCGEKIKLRDAYTLVKQAALHWNGSAENDEMLVPTNSMQTKFKLSQKVDIKQSLDNVVNRSELEIERFSNVLFMNYIRPKSGDKFEIEVDYSLYSLLNKIDNGYRPNMKDKSINVKFTDFVDKILRIGSKDEIIYIKKKASNKDLNYKLEHSPDFGYTFEVV